MTLRIDSHHHLWRYHPAEYGWIDDSLAVLRRHFEAEELAQEAASAGVAGTIVVQARQTIEETGDLLRIAHANPIIRGVVGWLPLASPEIAGHLESFGEAKLKGLRHVVQAEAAGFLSNPDFNRGIHAMQGAGLVYDVLIRKEQMEESIAFVDRHPNQVFVLDHLAKPAVGRDGFELWASHLRQLARRQNVFCKLSGLVTEAEGYRWSPATLAPYLDVALAAFGAGRLMIGTDWPVLTVGCGYAQWWETIETWCSPLSEPERDAILGATANRVYQLALEDLGESR